VTIYKKYVRRKKIFKERKEEGYKKFLLELKKLRERGLKLIPPDTLHFLIRRYSFFTTRGTLKKRWEGKARRYYFKFWIKRAEGAGFIESDGVNWIIKDKILKVSP